MAETSQYISSFGNDFETEALPKALPQACTVRKNAIMDYLVSKFQELPSPLHKVKMNVLGATASGQMFEVSNFVVSTYVR